MQIHGTSLIAGTEAETAGATFRAFDPALGIEIAPDFHEASLADVDAAMRAASEAFADYRARSAEARAAFLDAIAADIESLGDTLVARATAETGLPAARIQAERSRTCGQLRLFAEVVREGSWVDARIDTALPERQPLPRPDLRRMLLPLGPVVVFGSSNFPLAFSAAGGDTASALAAGCPVVVKAHRAHPGTGEIVGRAIARAAQRCGLPGGVFSLIHGGGATVGVAMVRHEAAAAVGFTGSHAAGRALFDVAASRLRPIPVFAEMSSLNPIVILPAALRARGAAIAQGLLGSFTLGVGQFCTKPGLVFVPQGADADQFMTALSAAVAAAPCGTMLTPGIRDAFVEHRDQVAHAVGVNVAAVSSAVALADKTQAAPSVGVTTGARFLASPELAIEAFGPFTLVIQCVDASEVARCVRSLEGQLTATVHADGEDLTAFSELLADLEQKAGRIVFNGFPTGVEVAPAMNHGGPYPATTDARFTSVGTAAMLRFARPVCYQNVPDDRLPPALQNRNPLGIRRMVNGAYTGEPI
jgi:alpha-ketoglutaric semialdehyde dehydrogenase